jgi:hypothetical protein
MSLCPSSILSTGSLTGQLPHFSFRESFSHPYPFVFLVRTTPQDSSIDRFVGFDHTLAELPDSLFEKTDGTILMLSVARGEKRQNSAGK